MKKLSVPILFVLIGNCFNTHTQYALIWSGGSDLTHSNIYNIFNVFNVPSESRFFGRKDCLPCSEK